MSWKTAHRSFYYRHAPEPADLVLPPARTALLVIDVQNTYLQIPADPDERARWAPFHARMRDIVIPNIADLVARFRAAGIERLFARIACLTEDGRDRSLSQKKPGFNYLLLPHTGWEAQIVPELAPQADEITVLKTTDSALTGTNLRLLLRNLGIQHVVVCGIFTDQCINMIYCHVVSAAELKGIMGL